MGPTSSPQHARAAYPTQTPQPTPHAPPTGQMMKASGVLPRTLTLVAVLARSLASSLQPQPLPPWRSAAASRRNAASTIHRAPLLLFQHHPPPLLPSPRTRLFSSSSSSSSSSFSPKKTIDRAQFDQTINVLALRLPAAACHTAIQTLAPIHFRTTRERSVVLPASYPALAPDERLLLLSPDDARGLKALLPTLLPTLPPTASLLQGGYPVQIGYEDLSVTQVLRQLLPPDVEVPSAFETVGTY